MKTLEHQYNPKHAFWVCIWCKKPLSQWRAFEVCHVRKAIEWLEGQVRDEKINLRTEVA